jgi:hypothetical protein
MSEGNGTDIAAVYQLLTEVARMVAAHDQRFDAHDRRFDQIGRRFDEQQGKLNELITVVNGHSHKLDDLAAGLAGLRESLTHYHASVLGHGVLIGELEERVRRIERHLQLDPAAG